MGNVKAVSRQSVITRKVYIRKDLYDNVVLSDRTPKFGGFTALVVSIVGSRW